MKEKCQVLFDSVIEKLKTYEWENDEAYANYLAQTYYYVCHSTRLLALAAGRMAQEDQALHQRFLKHTQEENAHELMALRDLKNLGHSIEEFPELPETRSFWETQYFKIEHVDPTALLGYIVMLEDVAARVCPWINQKLEKLYGKKAATFIRVHGEEDEDHVEEAYKCIFSLNENRQKYIFDNAIQSALNYQAMIDALQLNNDLRGNNIKPHNNEYVTESRQNVG